MTRASSGAKADTVKRRNIKVLIASGGSGGHIFPAIALGRTLKNIDQEAEILFVGSDKVLDRRLFEKEGVSFLLLSGNRLPYKPSWNMVPFFARLLFDTVKSFFIIVKNRPDAVIGFGGYISFPVLAASCALGIPRMVHEQNVVPGRANKILFVIADKVAISFEDTKKFMGRKADKAILSGNPIRTEILCNDKAGGIRRFGLDPDKFTILVIGGSQGAHLLNEAFVSAVMVMDSKTKGALQIIHITGVKDYEWALKAYAGAGIEHRVYSFVDRIEEAYAASNLAVTRSGSSALFELALLGMPMILVPYPFAMSHQAENAAVFSARGAAITLKEETLSPEIFKDTILNLMKDRDKLEAMGGAARRLGLPDASNTLARAVYSMIES